MADDEDQAGAAYSLAMDHLNHVKQTTNDPNQIADAQRGMDAALARITAVRQNKGKLQTAPDSADKNHPTKPAAKPWTIMGIPL